MNQLVETHNLTKKYADTVALAGVDISIRRGSIYGLVGDNGAGKTTFMKILTGQIFPTSGEVKLFGGYTQKDMEIQRARIGALLEGYGFFPGLTVAQNLEYFRLQKGIPGKQVVDEVLEIVNLQNAKRKKAKHLSMGMKQRLGLAVALLGSPELLILDEPINGLDASGIHEMRELFKKLNREKNITILLSSHILSELEQVATEYCFIKNGKVLEQISAEHLYEKCNEYIEIRVSDATKYAIVLEKEFGHTDYRVLPDGSIQIHHPKECLERYSEAAMNKGLAVYKINHCKSTLEEYYMNLMNGGNQSC